MVSTSHDAVNGVSALPVSREMLPKAKGNYPSADFGVVGDWEGKLRSAGSGSAARIVCYTVYRTPLGGVI